MFGQMRAGAEINQINDPPFQLHHSASVDACYNITIVASLPLVPLWHITSQRLPSTQPTSSGLSNSVIINCVFSLSSRRFHSTRQCSPCSSTHNPKPKQSKTKQREATQTQTQGPTIQGPAPPALSYYRYYWSQILSLSGSLSLASSLRSSGLVWSGLVSLRPSFSSIPTTLTTLSPPPTWAFSEAVALREDKKTTTHRVHCLQLLVILAARLFGVPRGLLVPVVVVDRSAFAIASIPCTLALESWPSGLHP